MGLTANGTRNRVMTFATIQRGRDNIPRFSSHGKFDSVAICYPTGVFKGPKTTVEPEVTVRKSLAERVHSLVVQGRDRSILCRAQPLRPVVATWIVVPDLAPGAAGAAVRGLTRRWRGSWWLKVEVLNFGAARGELLRPW